jgi:hypothetical protein
MSQLPIKIVAIDIKFFCFKINFVWRKPYPEFFEHLVFNTHMKSNMAQRLLSFPSNKHKKCEMQKHKDSDNISVKCKYWN